MSTYRTGGFRCGYRIRQSIMVGAAVAAGLFFTYFAWTNWKDLPGIEWNLMSIGSLLCGVALSSSTVAINGWIWWILLRDSGQRISIIPACYVIAVSQFVKYLPGNLAHHVGRVVMAKDFGLSVPVTLTTMVLEVLWVAGVGFGLAVIGVTVYRDGSSDISGIGGAYLSVPFLLLTATSLILLPWVGLWLMKRCAPSLLKKMMRGYDIEVPRLHVALAACSLMVTNFLILGIALKILAFGLLDVNAGGVLQLSCLFAGAWVAGFLLPGAPGGLGVRESVMLILLTPIFGAGISVSLSILLRIVTSLGDLLAYVVGVIVGRRSLGLTRKEK